MSQEQQEKEIDLLNKSVAELTMDDRQSLAKPVGIPGFFFPMVKVRKNGEGVAEYVVGGVESSTDPLIVYSYQPIERVNGNLFRVMPTPQMMPVLRDLILKSNPDNNNRLVTVFGDPASGKTFIFKEFAQLLHPKGALVVDCGGMNMRELFFRTVIDYGSGVKDQFENMLERGAVSKPSIDMLNEAFPGAITQNPEGKNVIDWDIVGSPRKVKVLDQATNQEKDELAEDFATATARAQKVMNAIYAKEGIELKENAFGIKTVPGILVESYISGQPVILDEFNKSKRGTLDAFQTYLQFINGEKGFDKITLQNPMSTSDTKNDLTSITLHRKDRKPSYLLYVSGNDATDGETTQELSESMETRLNPIRVGRPTLEAWKHRASQVLTGLPLTTLYDLYKSIATDKNKVAEFSEGMLILLKLGMTTDEIRAIAPYQVFFLKNFQNTVDAVEKLAAYYYRRQEMANQESDFYLNNKEKIDDRIADEVAAGGKKVHVSFRKLISDINAALQGTVEVKDPSSTKLTMPNFANLSELLNSFNVASLGAKQPAWYSAGDHLSKVIVEDIANNTQGMPKTCAALLTYCESIGIAPFNAEEAKKNPNCKNLGSLLRYDALKDQNIGDSTVLKAMQSVLLAALRSENPKLVGADDDVMPLAGLGRAVQEIKAEVENRSSLFVIANEDVNDVKGTPLVGAESVLPYYSWDEETDELVDFRTVLAALAMPEYGPSNLKRLWAAELRVKADNIEQMLKSPVTLEEGQTAETPEQAEKRVSGICDILAGKSETGVNFIMLAAKSGKTKQQKQVYLYVFQDVVTKSTLIVGPEKIKPNLETALLDAHVQYICKDDSSLKEKVDAFVYAGQAYRIPADERDQERDDEQTKLVACMLMTLTAVFNTKEGLIPKDSTIGGFIASNDDAEEPSIYTTIVKPKKAAVPQRKR